MPEKKPIAIIIILGLLAVIIQYAIQSQPTPIFTPPKLTSNKQLYYDKYSHHTRARQIIRYQHYDRSAVGAESTHGHKKPMVTDDDKAFLEAYKIYFADIYQLIQASAWEGIGACQYEVHLP